MQLDRTIRERHSVRSFSSKKPDWKKIIEAIDAANNVPLAGNIPSLRFILVSDKEKIQKLAKASRQNFIVNAYYLVIVCSDEKKIVSSYDERGRRYCRQQAGAAIQNFLLKITDMGLASCWVGAFSDETIKRILNIPEDIFIEAILPVGYEYQRFKRRKKPDLDNVLFFNEYKNKYMKPIRKPEAF